MSALSCFGAFSGVHYALGGDWSRITLMYIMPLLIFNGWITLVTYLQVRITTTSSSCHTYR